MAINSPELAATLLDASPDGMLVVEAGGEIVLANPAACELFGIPFDELVGTNVDRLVPSEHRGHHEELRARYRRDPRSRPMGTGPRLLAEHRDGSLFPVEISLSPVEVESLEYTIATVRDVSQRQADAAQLAMLRDRERIARDLHDMVIQRLFGAGMGLQAIASAAEPPMVGERIIQVIDELDETIRELRAAIFRLSEQPEGVTLGARVRQIVDERARVMPLTPSLTLDDAVDDLPGDLADQLVATLNEALSNVSRHAQASSCEVSIECAGDVVRLTVIDDGVGVPEKIIRRGGLSNMLDRATVLGGSCSIDAAPGGGTVVDWSVPI